LHERGGGAHVAVECRVRGTEEEGVQRVVLPHRERIELVVVTDSTPDGQPEPGLRGGTGPIDRVAIEPLRLDRPTLTGRHATAVEPGGGQLVWRRVREQ